MELLTFLWSYAVPFLVVLTVLVFVHELGHYLLARRNGVRVEVFSIGFGREIFGFTDRNGTRWKFSLIPLGGYVKMFGESEVGRDEESREAGGSVPAMSDAERAVSFHTKRVGRRAAIVAAGPVANFLFAVLVFAGMYATVGQPFTAPVIGTVQADSAAARAGLRPGDEVRSIAGIRIERFQEIQRIVRTSPGRPLALVIEREGREVALAVTPDTVVREDRFGNRVQIGLLGVTGGVVSYTRRGPVAAVWEATRDTVALTQNMLAAVGQIVVGQRGTDELGGPLRIAQMSGQVAKGGLLDLLFFTAVLSINLGLINLFPIPMLDGGHLIFYLIEVVRGRPLGPRAQDYGFRIGLALVLSLIVFVTFNDLVHLQVFEYVRRLIG